MGLPLFAATGDELVDALRRAGFFVTHRSDDRVTLGRALRTVIVSTRGKLQPAELLGALRDAGITYLELLDLFDHAHGSSVHHRTVSADRPPSHANDTEEGS